MSNIVRSTTGSALFLEGNGTKIYFRMGEKDFLATKEDPEFETPNSRLKVKINLLKKKFLEKMNQRKSDQRNEQVLQQRRKALSDFRIDFMPLCCEEDMEIIATSMAKDGTEKNEKDS